MGGIIEDKILEVLLGEKMNCREMKMNLENIENISCVREYGTVDKHLRKMYNLKILEREKVKNGAYLYWNQLERSKVIENERI